MVATAQPKTPFDPADAARLVAEAFGPGARLADWRVLEPWAVARLQLADAPVRSAILKWVRRHPVGFRTDRSQMLTEHTALGFLATISPQLVPRRPAADLDQGLMLSEALCPRRPLLELIIEDPAARPDIVCFATDIAKLHAASLGRSDEYYQARRVLGPVDPQEELRRYFLEGAWSAQDIGTYLEAPMGRTAEADLGRAVDVLTEPGAFLAFSNGDCGLNNYLIGPDDGRSSISSSPASGTCSRTWPASMCRGRSGWR